MATPRKPKIAIVFYSKYGHIEKLAKAELKGIEAEGGTAELFSLPDTLSDTVHDHPHPDPGLDKREKTLPEKLQEFDAFLFGIPTRYGNFPAQWKAFWDKTAAQWKTGGYAGKYAGLFVSTATPGGGQESTAIAAMSTLTHHGIIYVPLGYSTAFALLANLSEVRGGSPWGAGTFASPDGSREPSALELELAETQGKSFYRTIDRVKFFEEG
ncbi:MAG: Minor allergen Alt a 7 [Thelocarpon impressellum]|nr:MAG: Minor allergen Alt a 7 [Thelocarpon impressellum]